MKTDIELNHLSNQICRGTEGLARKLLRSIELDALREAREVVEKHPCLESDYPNPALPELDKLIQSLELA